ncbi:hypothetical protein ACFL2U_02675 [Patescibacteria group bacterium]
MNPQKFEILNKILLITLAIWVVARIISLYTLYNVNGEINTIAIIGFLIYASFIPGIYKKKVTIYAAASVFFLVGFMEWLTSGAIIERVNSYNVFEWLGVVSLFISTLLIIYIWGKKYKFKLQLSDKS